MKLIALTLLASLALTNVTFGGVVLKLEDKGPLPGGLHRYILQAEGAGITTLSKFIIPTPVYQGVGSNTEWSIEDTVYLGSVDSHVIFGKARMPDLKGALTPPLTTKVTKESGAVGLGTLSNYDPDNETWDAYVRTGVNPDGATPVQTVDLMRLVIAEGDDLSVSLRISTYTGYTVVYENNEYHAYGGTVETFDLMYGFLPGDANKDGRVSLPDLDALGTNWGKETGALWAEGDFNGDGKVSLPDLDALGSYWGQELSWYAGAASTSVPEPSTLVMLMLGVLCLLGYRARK